MKQKKCKVCRTEFTPRNSMQKVCGTECAVNLAKKLKSDRDAKAQVVVRKETKAKLEKLKTKGDYIKEAQNAFNRYIRLRDAALGCISCGADCGAASVGGSGDAGHFRSRGSAPHLRFDERNCHLQCKKCNRYLSGNVGDYRRGLVERIGQEAVDGLERDQSPRNYNADDLKAIKSKYSAMARELEKANG